MTLPLVEVFHPHTPYEAWTRRKLTPDEVRDATRRAGRPVFEVDDHLVARITSPLQAARHVARVGVDNDIDHFVNDRLDVDVARRAWQARMPSRTPRELTRYQHTYDKCDLAAVDRLINAVGAPLSAGQVLFHCGLWPANTPQQVCTRPLSTTFCPQVALLNALYRAKAYDANRVDLCVLHVRSPQTRVFVYRRKGTKFGHENEVLLASGATLRLRKQDLIRSKLSVSQVGAPNKRVPVYVLQVDCD